MQLQAVFSTPHQDFSAKKSGPKHAFDCVREVVWKREDCMDREPYANTISSAVEFFEGYGTLAVILNVSVEDLRRWAEGKSYPPADVYHRIVNLTKRTERVPKLRLN
jgi:hypothetical protein